MQIKKVQITAGLRTPVKIAQITDVHLALADNFDGDDMLAHAEKRTAVFRREAGEPEKKAEEYFSEAVAYARDNCDMTVITGDVIDYISHANWVCSDEILRDCDYMFTPGNHEFCPKVGIPDSFARRVDLFASVQKHFNGNMNFESRVIGGLNIITLDNGYYVFNGEQLEFFKGEIRKGLPIVLFMHVPMTDERMTHEIDHRYLVPDSYQREVTSELYDLICNCGLVRCIMTGHLHIRESDCVLPCGIPQYICGSCFKGKMIEYEIN